MDAETIRSKLEDKREEVTSRIRANRSEPDEPFNPDRADLAQEYADRERRMAQIERLENVLEEVEDALQRLEDGSYGRCERCGEEISPERLEALPYASLCVRCQERVQAEMRYR